MHETTLCLCSWYERTIFIKSYDSNHLLFLGQCFKITRNWIFWCVAFSQIPVLWHLHFVCPFAFYLNVSLDLSILYNLYKSYWGAMYLQVDLLKHGIPDPSSLNSAYLQSSNAGPEKENKDKVSEAEEYMATPLFVHTKWVIILFNSNKLQLSLWIKSNSVVSLWNKLYKILVDMINFPPSPCRAYLICNYCIDNQGVQFSVLLPHSDFQRYISCF